MSDPKSKQQRLDKSSARSSQSVDKLLTNSPTLPKTIGRYQVLGVVGKGGMADVYKGLDPKLERVVAIKRIRFRTEDSQAKFGDKIAKWEAIVSSKLHHPSIINTYDYIEENGEYSIIMEYFPGKEIGQFFAEQQRINLPLIREVFIKICRGLEHAHQQGVLHRDLKPSNILIDETTREIKILDFGISTLLDDARDFFAQKDTFFGTLEFASPEAIKMEKLDARSDIFSLGVVLYEILAGSNPFKGETLHETIRNIAGEDVFPPSHFLPKLPKAFDYILLKMLQKDPANRYHSLPDVVQDLQQFEALDYYLRSQDSQEYITEEVLRKKPESSKSQRPIRNMVIVDEDPLLCNIVCTVMERNRFVVRIFSTIEDARKALEEKTADVIVADASRQEKAMFDFCRQLQRDPELSSIPVILVSSAHGPLHRINGLKAGATDYLSKPFHPQELLLRIDAILARSNDSDWSSLFQAVPDMEEVEYVELDKTEEHASLSGELNFDKLFQDNRITEVLFRRPEVLELVNELGQDVGDDNEPSLASYWVLSIVFPTLSEDQQKEIIEASTGLEKNLHEAIDDGEMARGYALLNLLTTLQPTEPAFAELADTQASRFRGYFEAMLSPLKQKPIIVTDRIGSLRQESVVLDGICRRLDGRTSLLGLMQIQKSDPVQVLYHVFVLKEMGLFLSSTR